MGQVAVEREACRPCLASEASYTHNHCYPAACNPVISDVTVTVNKLKSFISPLSRQQTYFSIFPMLSVILRLPNHPCISPPLLYPPILLRFPTSYVLHSSNTSPTLGLTPPLQRTSYDPLLFIFYPATHTLLQHSPIPPISNLLQLLQPPLSPLLLPVCLQDAILSTFKK